jgi:tol-pal system protein YbgF
MRQGFSRRLGICLLSVGIGLATWGWVSENALSQTSSKGEPDQLYSTLDEIRRELAGLKSDLRTLRETDLRNSQGITDLTKRQNRVEDRAKEQMEALQNTAEQLQTNVLQWLATLDDKQAAKFREFDVKFRELGKKIDESLLAQDQRIKKVEQEGRDSNKQITSHLGEVDKSLVKMSDTIKMIGTELATQNKQQSVALAQLEESNKQSGLQFSQRVDQLKVSLAELSKAMHALNDKSAATDRRITELSSQTESKLGALVIQEGEQTAKMDRLAKRMETETQAMTAHVNSVTQNVNGLAKSLETVQTRMAQLASQNGQNENQDARIEALTKTLNATVSTLNESTRSLGDLKQVLEMSVSKLATRIDEQGEVLNRVMQRGAAERPGANGHADSASQDLSRKSAPVAKAGQDVGLRPEAAYDHAYQEFMQNQYDSALASFQNFLSQFPDSALVPNAHFWIAECYVRKRDYARGIEAYEQVIRHYPRSGKASSALFRKAAVLLVLNDKPGAKSALHQVIADYPKSEESKQAKAKLATLQ